MTTEQNVQQCGYFIISLDTELATGQFDRDEARHRMFSPDGSRERQAVHKLLQLFDEFGIVGTWAVVGHLFYEACENCEICPLKDWRGKYSSFDEAYQSRSPLWYGADIVECLLQAGSRQEIGFHGYSHRLFDEHLMSPQEAVVEVQEWLRVAGRKGIAASSATYPRNQAGHLDILREAGMLCYRRDPRTPAIFKNRVFGKYVKTAGMLTGLSKVPVYAPVLQKDHGLVALDASTYLFDFNRSLELFLDSMHLHNLRISRIVEGVRKAAREKKIIHLWAHPCDFRSEKDFLKLRRVLLAVSQEVSRNRMRSVGMSEMARLLIEEDAACQVETSGPSQKRGSL